MNKLGQKLVKKFHKAQSELPLDNTRVYTVSMSGGKDSTATALWCMKYLRSKGKVLFYTTDTGWEHDLTYKYIKYLEDEMKINIEVRRSDAYEGFEDMCIKRKFIPSRVNRICTRELKVFPSQKYLKELQRQCYDVINITGVRRDESAARAGENQWKFNFYMKKTLTKIMYKIKEGVITYQPIVYWNTQMVFDYHKKYGLDVNPLYKLGYSRVGCYPCIMAKVSEIGMVDEVRSKRITQLEFDVSQAAGAKRLFLHKGGKVIEFKDANEFYNDKYGGESKTCFNQHGICE